MIEQLWNLLGIPKRKCRGRVKDGRRCNNDVKALYCHIHRPFWLKVIYGILILLLLLLSLGSRISSIYNAFQSSNDQAEVVEQCDMYSMGCQLNISSANNRHSSNEPNSYPIKLECGDINIIYFTYTDGTVIRFPSPLKPIEGEPPYKLKIESGKVKVEASLDDYLSNDPLGSFDWESFEINSYDTGCAYSYNMDDYSVEVINKNKEVCFALNFISEWRFNGYFKDSEGFLHCYNGNRTLLTKDLNKAKYFIKNINKIFIHSEFDSLGKKLNVLGKKIPYKNGNPSYPKDKYRITQ